MTLRNAAVFAIVGMALWTICTAINLFTGVSGLARGIESLAVALSDVIHFLASLSLLVFFVVYHRSQA